MSTPARVRDELIKDLRAAKSRLMSPEWLTMIRAAPKAQRQAAAENLMKISLALLDLENEALASFRDELITNESRIATATQAIRNALSRLETVTKVLSAVKGLIDVIARVITLV